MNRIAVLEISTSSTCASRTQRSPPELLVLVLGFFLLFLFVPFYLFPEACVAALVWKTFPVTERTRFLVQDAQSTIVTSDPGDTAVGFGVDSLLAVVFALSAPVRSSPWTGPSTSGVALAHGCAR